MPSRPFQSAFRATLGGAALVLTGGLSLLVLGIPEPPARDAKPRTETRPVRPPETAHRSASMPAGSLQALAASRPVAPPTLELIRPAARTAPAHPAAIRTLTNHSNGEALVSEVATSTTRDRQLMTGPALFIETTPTPKMPDRAEAARPPAVVLPSDISTAANPGSSLKKKTGADFEGENHPIDVHLTRLQRQVDQLAQVQSDQRGQELERMTQLLQQLQTNTQMQDIERRLQQLQSPPPAPTNSTTPVTTPALPSPEPPAVEPPRKEKTAESIVRIEPNEDQPERFSLQIQDAEIAQVLEMLGQLAGENILVGTGVSGKVSANLQDVTLDEALRGILRSLGHVYERDERFIFVMTAAEAQQRKTLDRKLITKIYRPNYISARDLEKLISPLLTPTIGKVAVTIPNEQGIKLDREAAGGDTQSQTDAVLVQDYNEVIDEVDGIVAEMDVPPQQVVIEAMILSVRLSDELRFGVNFALLNKGASALIVSGDGAAIGGSAGFPSVSGTIPVPPIGGSPFTAIPGGLKLGLLKGDTGAFVQALESIADTNLIAAPQLRALNKQKAELIIGNRTGYSTTVINGNTAIQNVNFLDSGTKLVMRPYIAPDGLVRLEIHPERSAATINTATNLPDLETTEVTTNVMVRDGSTVVIGGLIVEETLQSTDRVPVLGAIPLVGNLFRSRVDRNVRSELIVLITPRIVCEPEAAMEGAAIRAEGEMRADYFRNHLAPINRRNMARMYYDAALRNYDLGNLRRARHEIRESLRLDKNDLDALRLRSQIEAAYADQQPWQKLQPFSESFPTEPFPPEPALPPTTGPEFLPPPAPAVETNDGPPLP